MSIRNDFPLELLISIRQLDNNKFQNLVCDLQIALSIVQKCSQFDISEEYVKVYFGFTDVRQVKDLKRGLLKFAPLQDKLLAFMATEAKHMRFCRTCNQRPVYVEFHKHQQTTYRDLCIPCFTSNA